jgi:branched-chain amino acid transport system ATP-binding protein
MFQLFPRLKERINQQAGTLSGGEQQMLAMSRALMAKPKLLLLDEPSLGLAPIFIDQIFEVIRKIADEGTTILLVEQNAQLALEICDYGYVLEVGEVAMSDSGDKLLNNSLVRKSYLGEN